MPVGLPSIKPTVAPCLAIVPKVGVPFHRTMKRITVKRDYTFATNKNAESTINYLLSFFLILMFRERERETMA